MNTVGSPSGPCEEIRPLLEAYHDGEMADDAAKTAIEAHLRECGGCREELRALEALDDKLQSMPELEGSEAFALAVDREAEWNFPARDTSGARRWRWLAAGVMAATVMFGAVGSWQWVSKSENVTRRSEGPDELLAFIEDHVAYVQSDAAPVRETDDPSKMEEWFEGRLEFTPELPRWPWAELVSGRLCFIHGQRVARLHYRGGGGDLTLFIQPLEAGKEAQADSSVMERSLRGYRVACWKAHGLDYVLVAPSSAAGKVFEKVGEQG